MLDTGTKPCIPGRTSRDRPVEHDKRRHKRRHRIEMLFARLKGWRRVATRHDCRPIALLSAITLAAAVMVWLGVLTLRGACRSSSDEDLACAEMTCERW